jgi:hypothetical protein
MLRKTVVARALSIAFSTAALSAAVMQPAAAQSNAAGTVYGKVNSGSATSVVLRNTDTNQQRTVQVDANGSFSASSLAAGHYRATLQGGSMNGRTAEVDVIAGQGVEAVFTTDVARVEVTGRRSRIDVSNATNGATFTSRELEKLPVAHNVDAIIQLAPNTAKSDPTYSAGHSIGGGAPSENAYYINGFPVTNALTQLGSLEMPFGAVATAEIKTGGYGAEFGRSVGGVVNITGKNGTNSWEAGAQVSSTPARWRAAPKDMYYPVIGAPNTAAFDGTLRIRNSENQAWQKQYGAYVGGPIIKDKLFMFVAGEHTDINSAGVAGGRTSTTLAVNGYSTSINKLDRYYTKFDFNITDNHRLEYTSLGDTPDITSSSYGYNYTTHQVGTKATSTIHTKTNSANGGEVQMLRYTGNLTDDLTVTSLYGVLKSRHIYEPAGYDPSIPQVSAPLDTQVPGFSYTNQQPFSSVATSGAEDQTKSFRFDLEYKLGQHTIKAGLDRNKSSSLGAGSQTAGGALWIYAKTPDPSKPIPVGGGVIPAMASFGTLAAQGYYVSKNIGSTVSNAYAGQTAQYVEDNWQVTKNVLVKLGVRNEGFYNANQDNTKYIDQKNSILPRASAIWDVNGDSSMKVFGSAGRYSVPMPVQVALRAANGSLNTSQYFAYTGVDSHGAPTGLTALTAPLSANNEFGQAKDPKTLAAIDMKPSAQDELTLGFERAFSPDLNFGAKVTYRTLKDTIDDFCDSRPFYKYAAAHNIDASKFDGGSCESFNPGLGNSFWVDYTGTRSNYTRVDLSNADLGNFEKAQRKYTAVDIFFEHPYRNGWYAKVNYTWSRDKGNTEGQTLSDTNSAQGDISATMAWDYPEMMQYANGLLPNDHTHQIKAFGWYDLTKELTLGANVDIESGRPMGCLGANPHPNADSPNYFGYEHYCFGSGTYTTNVPAPRGTFGRLPWTKSLDMNLTYKPEFLKGFGVKLDVFNVFNTQTMLKRIEQYNSGVNRSPSYGGVLSYTAPRSAKITAEYNHKF